MTPSKKPLRTKFSRLVRRSSIVRSLVSGGVLCALASPTSATVFLGHTPSLVETPTFYEHLGTYTSENEIRSDPAPGGFTYDFSAMGETTISYTWTAPVGQKFVIAAPADFDQGVSLFIRFRGGGNSGGSGVFDDGNADYVINGASSAKVPTQATGYLSGPIVVDTVATYAFGIDFSLIPGEVYSFQSATLTTTVPASYAGVFDNVTFGNTSSLYALASSNTAVSDPGQWMSLQAIPEPGSIGALFGAIVALSALGRRRRL